MNTDAIISLHARWLACWNTQDAMGMTSQLTDDANMVGFDGSQMNGRKNIEAELSKVFENHKTRRYVWKVQEVRFLTEQVAILRAIAGMVPAGKMDLEPAVNAIQSVVAVRQEEDWKISLFQNTPAQFHGR